ncbi:Uncharacterised protein [Mycoplasmopsis citelli]|uniref:Uncharacterized protein n=1 Tax=Mycoplasmopsis citelli TaxID=171281 RepID=A0A449B118_9BACT|nr:hypothetical protein [Mycoplasmopsis citelli]VEU74299.1 Uncharacterised protein [Mycoplasmopsis citelli]
MAWILNAIFAPLLLAIWKVFVVIPFSIIEFMSNIFNKIGIELIIRLLFGDQAFEKGVFKVHYIYVVMSILAGTAFSLVIIISLIKTFFDAQKGNEKRIGIYKKIIPATVSIVAFPSLTFLLLMMIFNLQSLLYIVFFGHDKGFNFDLGKSTFLSLKPTGIEYNDWEAVANNGYIALWLPYSTKFNFAITMVLLAVIGIAILLQLLSLSISLVSHLLSTVAFFFLQPIVNVSRFYDEERLYGKWKRIYYKKLSIILFYTFSLNIFILVIGFLNNIDFQVNNFFALAVIKLILIGGSLAGVQVLIGDISELFGGRESVKSGFRVARDIANGAQKTAFAVAGGVGFAKGATQGAFKFLQASKGSLIGDNLARKGWKADMKAGKISSKEYWDKVRDQKEEIKRKNLRRSDYASRTGIGGWVEDKFRSTSSRLNHFKLNRADKNYKKGKINSDTFDSKISKAMKTIDKRDKEDNKRWELKRNPLNYKKRNNQNGKEK